MYIFTQYPGVRCDSTIYSFGFSFKPWLKSTRFPQAEDIKTYLEEAIQEFELDKYIQLGVKVEKASWWSGKQSNIDHSNDNGAAGDENDDGHWEIESAKGEKFQSRFLYMCSGYYKYDKGFSPSFEGTEEFMKSTNNENQKRIIVHSQEWNNQFDYSGLNVAIVGSGATAVTTVPTMVIYILLFIA